MRLKQLFRFPELALLISILLGPTLIGNTTIDIQLHDTLYVFGGTSWGENTLFRFINLSLFISWLSHILLRKHNLLPRLWRWIQVSISLICLITIILVAQSMHQDALNFRALDHGDIYKYNFLSNLLPLSILIFILCQLGFWIRTVILLVMYKRSAKRTLF